MGLLDGDGVACLDLKEDVDPGEAAVCLWVEVPDPALVRRREDGVLVSALVVRSPEGGVLDPGEAGVCLSVGVVDSGVAVLGLRVGVLDSRVAALVVLLPDSGV